VAPIFRGWAERFAWGYIREMEHFISCIQTNTPSRVGGQDGRWAVAGALAGTRSFFEERPVYLSEILDEAWNPG
jgi:predicted dehydrogenase